MENGGKAGEGGVVTEESSMGVVGATTTLVDSSNPRDSCKAHTHMVNCALAEGHRY